MDSCPKCNGKLQNIPEKNIGIFKSIGIYLLLEISFWIIVVIVFSFGTMSFDTAIVITLTILLTFTAYLLFRHSYKVQCKKCKQRFEGVFKWEMSDDH